MRGITVLQIIILLTGLEAFFSVGYGKDLPGAEKAEPSAAAPTTDQATAVDEIEGEDAGSDSDSALKASWETRTDARALSLQIPAPRGQIVDRNGIPFAQTCVRHYLALQIPAGEEITAATVVGFAKAEIDKANELLETEWSSDEAAILSHFERRRWMPLVVSPELTDRQKGKLQSLISELESSESGEGSESGTGSALKLFATYCRSYPRSKSASHIIGYTGRVAATSTEEVISGEPLFPHLVGRDGLEASFDEYLNGEAGEIHQLYDESGKKLIEELVRRPVPGNNVVTTLDYGMQKLAEDTLARYCRRGALVVLDVHTGEVLALASRPDFDPNQFVPRISEEAFAELRDDPAHPLFARAFRGVYPPASTYKVVTALAALEAGEVDAETRIDSPGSMMIGGRRFRNWHAESEGKIGLRRALARSSNTWFYKVGMQTGGDAFAAMSTKLGFGEPCGLPLAAEARGFVPTHANMQESYGHALSDGYLANAAIGQGHVTSSPLQVAQMMAAVANGEYLPHLRLVSEISDLDGRVVERFPAEARHDLEISPYNLQLVRDGLSDVVNASHGTGKKAFNSYHLVAGKTGTGQWGPLDKRQYVAWFAGYLPADDPKYAFAAIYEGRPGETLSGGKKAAPIVATFFNRFYGGSAYAINSRVLTQLGHKPPKRVALPKIQVAAAEEEQPIEVVPAAKTPKRPLLRRIFGRRRG